MATDLDRLSGPWPSDRTLTMTFIHYLDGQTGPLPSDLPLIFPDLDIITDLDLTTWPWNYTLQLGFKTCGLDLEPSDLALTVRIWSWSLESDLDRQNLSLEVRIWPSDLTLTFRHEFDLPTWLWLSDRNWPSNRTLTFSSAMTLPFRPDLDLPKWPRSLAYHLTCIRMFPA